MARAKAIPNLSLNQSAKQAPAVDPIPLHPTALHHIFLVDINDDGQVREVAIVKKWGNGSIAYIDVGLLDEIDRRRMATLCRSFHADKYELFDIMYLQRLSNGLNALEYFSQLTKTKLAPGSNVSAHTGSLAALRPDNRNNMVGAEFSDPQSASLSDD